MRWQSQQYSCQNTSYPSRTRHILHSLSKANVIRFEDFPGGSTVFHYSPTISLTRICLRIVPSGGSLPSQRQISLQATNRTAGKKVHMFKSFLFSTSFFFSQKVKSCHIWKIIGHFKSQDRKIWKLLAKMFKITFQAVREKKILSLEYLLKNLEKVEVKYMVFTDLITLQVLTVTCLESLKIAFSKTRKWSLIIFTVSK